MSYVMPIIQGIGSVMGGTSAAGGWGAVLSQAAAGAAISEASGGDWQTGAMMGATNGLVGMSGLSGTQTGNLIMGTASKAAAPDPPTGLTSPDQVFKDTPDLNQIQAMSEDNSLDLSSLISAQQPVVQSQASAQTPGILPSEDKVKIDPKKKYFEDLNNSLGYLLPTPQIAY